MNFSIAVVTTHEHIDQLLYHRRRFACLSLTRAILDFFIDNIWLCKINWFSELIIQFYYNILLDHISGGIREPVVDGSENTARPRLSGTKLVTSGLTNRTRYKYKLLCANKRCHRILEWSLQLHINHSNGLAIIFCTLLVSSSISHLLLLDQSRP